MKTEPNIENYVSKQFDSRVNSYTRKNNLGKLKNVEQAARMFTDVMNKHSHEVEAYSRTPIPEEKFENGMAWQAVFPNTKAGVAMYSIHHTLGKWYHAKYQNICDGNGGEAPLDSRFNATLLDVTEKEVLEFTESVANNPIHNIFRKVLPNQDEADMVFYYAAMANSAAGIRGLDLGVEMGNWMFVCMYHLAFVTASERVTTYKGSRCDWLMFNLTAALRWNTAENRPPVPHNLNEVFGMEDEDVF